jgi:isopentenyl-diphosphate delta-isomerase
MKKDPTASSRKQDHIELAFQSRILTENLDSRFYYEPLLSAHPNKINGYPKSFLNKQILAPIWVSSMTGGTEKASMINKNLAMACKEFGLSMGLGSCRSILDSDDRLSDFAMRSFIGDQPLFANLGTAQLEELIKADNLNAINRLIEKLEADGIIIHVNPLQEWLQDEGDQITTSPIDVIRTVLREVRMPIIVKEVGQGFGPESLKELLQLPLEAIEFAASGGTNFSLLELLRSSEERKEAFQSFANIGHSAEQMVGYLNDLIPSLGPKVNCRNFIISGGITNFLDGYYHISKLNHNAIYGQASSMLKHAQISYEALHQYISLQIEGLKFASAYLRIKS